MKLIKGNILVFLGIMMMGLGVVAVGMPYQSVQAKVLLQVDGIPLGTCMSSQDSQDISPSIQNQSSIPTISNLLPTTRSSLPSLSQTSFLNQEASSSAPNPPPNKYQSQRHAPILRPYIYSGMEISNAGYKPLSAIFGTGLDWERRHSLGIVEAWGDNATKGGFNTGYDVGAKIRGFYKIDNGYFFGGGYQWSKLVTPTYEKQSGRPTFGFGRDVNVNKVRAQVLYILPGTDHVNALQGPEFTIWIPSPTRPGHWFFRESIGVYEFHASANPWNDGTHNRGTAGFTQTTVMFRF